MHYKDLRKKIAAQGVTEETVLAGYQAESDQRLMIMNMIKAAGKKEGK